MGRKPEINPETARLLGIGLQITSIVLVSIFVGFQVEKEKPTKHHLWLIGFSVSGIIIALYVAVSSYLKK